MRGFKPHKGIKLEEQIAKQKKAQEDWIKSAKGESSNPLDEVNGLKKDELLAWLEASGEEFDAEANKPELLKRAQEIVTARELADE